MTDPAATATAAPALDAPPADALPLAVIPPGATFRRAEGLRVRANPCAGLDALEVTAERPGGGTRAVLDRDEARLLFRMNRWQSAAELGASPAALAALVDADFAFYAPGRPARDLGGEPLAALADRVALRRNVTVAPLISTPARYDDADADAQPIELPFMPRRGELDGCVLVGFEFAVMEFELDTHAIAVACCARHGRVLRELVPRLDGRHDAAALAADPDAAALLALLADLGLLTRAEPPPPSAPDASAAQITWLCHAAVLYEAAGRRLLVDPLEYPCSLPSRHAVLPPDLRAIGPVDAVLITHADNDHLNPRALCRIAPGTPVYVPAAPSVEPYQVDAEALLAVLGFDRVHTLAPWDRVAFGEVTVVAAPFRGEDWGLALAAQAFVLHAPALTVYLNADSTSTPEAYARIAAEFPIDLALLGVTGAAEAHVMPPRYGYGHFYAPWIPPARRNEWVALCNGPRESAEVARALGARYAFGYAAGGAPFAAQAYTDRGTHAELAAELARLGASTRPLALPLGEAVRVP